LRCVTLAGSDDAAGAGVLPGGDCCGAGVLGGVCRCGAGVLGGDCCGAGVLGGGCCGSSSAFACLAGGCPKNGRKFSQNDKLLTAKSGRC